VRRISAIGGEQLSVARSCPDPLCVLLADERVQQGDDLLLAGRRGVEFASHLDEAVVYLSETAVHLLPEIGQVLAHGVEAGGGGLAEVPDLGADLGDVAVGAAGQDAGGGGVLADVVHVLADLVQVAF